MIGKRKKEEEEKLLLPLIQNDKFESLAKVGRNTFIKEQECDLSLKEVHEKRSKKNRIMRLDILC